MHRKIVTVTETARNFSDFINRVTYYRERFLLYKGKKPVAELRPAVTGRRLGDLLEIVNALPHLAKNDAVEFTAEIRRYRTKTSKEKLKDPWAF